MSESERTVPQEKSGNEEIRRIEISVEPEAQSLVDRIESDYKMAMHERDQNTINTLRLIRAAFRNLLVSRTDKKNKEFGKTITGSDFLTVLEKQVKQREESIEIYSKNNRPEKAAEEKAEAEVLRRYLPEQLSREEIVDVVRKVISEVGSDFRKVMPAAVKELKGKADGRTIQGIVKEITG